MKLQRLELRDFRLYEGRQQIDFATDPQKNVTLIYGANGGGKTTLLNAFLWVLYGKFTDDVQQPNRIVNNESWNKTEVGAYAEASVLLQFEHEGNDYTLIRSVKCEKADAGADQAPEASKLTFRFTDASGKSYEKANPEEAVDTILPKRLKDFFFFNGERIENLVSTDAYQEIEAAIKTLLGLEIIERAYLKHLPEARKRLQREFSQVGDDETQKLVNEELRLQDELAEVSDELAQSERNASAIAREIAAIDDELRGLADTKDLQELRDRLQKDREGSLRREAAARKRQNEIVNEFGFLAFISELLDGVAETSAALRSRGEIPTPLKRQFVEDLLERGECICGTALVAGEVAHDHVAEWKFKAGIQEVEESWTTLAANARQCAEDRGALVGALEAQNLLIAEEVAARVLIEEELSEVTTKLAGSDLANVQQLEARRSALKQDERGILLSMGATTQRKQSLEREISQIDSRIRKAAAQGKKAQVAKERVEVVSDVQEVLGRILEMQTESVRDELNDKVKTTYKKIAIKDFEPELTSDFTLQLWERSGRGKNERSRAPMSTGENQILSLSFVGALAALARERSTASSSQGGLFDSLGGVFPIVMDAAFGSLDNNYRRDVAAALPKLAPQIVVLVSKAQGEGPVAEHLAPHVGATYVMTIHTVKDDLSEEAIEIGGKAFPYVVPGSGSNSTKLLKVGG